MLQAPTTLPETAPTSIHYHKNGGLYYAVISDIHLGHNKNPARRIVANLFKALPDNAETASLDIIFLAGDVFDDVLLFNDEDIFDIKSWVRELLYLCKKYNIELVVLEGTPGHDRKQSQYFVMENDINQIGAKLRYVTELAIEYFEHLDIHVLFVPDELAGGPEATLRSVKDLMRAKGLEKVDHAIMHGLFKFQLPNHVDNVATHDAEEYLQLVKHNIFIGHDHTYKQFDRIYVQGSFDRLGQGYETPKGHMRAKHQPDGSWEIRFIENEGAMRFVTMNAMGKTLEETLALAKATVVGLPDDSHIRVRADSNHPIFTNMDSLLRIDPFVKWTKDPQRDKDKALAPLVETHTKYVPITITVGNIAGLILEKIANEGATGAIMDASIELLEELFPTTRRVEHGNNS